MPLPEYQILSVMVTSFEDGLILKREQQARADRKSVV